jgi:hypothetical protein
MDLEVFIRCQQSEHAFMCINQEHSMPLVAKYDLDRKVELKCFDGHCDFIIRPGLKMYEDLLKQFPG